jgi:hypothetical protein
MSLTMQVAVFAPGTPTSSLGQSTLLLSPHVCYIYAR